jgi:hypothetical protein
MLVYGVLVCEIVLTLDELDSLGLMTRSTQDVCDAISKKYNVDVEPHGVLVRHFIRLVRDCRGVSVNNNSSSNVNSMSNSSSNAASSDASLRSFLWVQHARVKLMAIQACAHSFAIKPEVSKRNFVCACV